MARKRMRDYDFFGDGQYDDSRSSRRAQNRRPSRRDAGRRFAATKASSPTSILCRRLAVVSGLLAVVVSATSAVHEIAPYAISFMTAVPGRYIALMAAVLIGITLILVIAARVTMLGTPLTGEWARAASSHWCAP